METGNKSPAQRLREIRAVSMGSAEILVHMKMREFNQLIQDASEALERAAKGPGSAEGTELARRLRGIAEVGIVNARRDAADLRRAADWIEAADERIAIMAESLGGGLPLIQPGGNVDLLAALEEGERFSGLTEEE